MEYDNFLTLLSEYLPEPLDSNPDFARYLRDTDHLLD